MLSDASARGPRTPSAIRARSPSTLVPSAPPGRVARAAGGARVGRGKFKKPLRRDLFASHAARSRFFACPQPQPHLRAGGVSSPQTRRSERLLDAGADDGDGGLEPDSDPAVDCPARGEAGAGEHDVPDQAEIEKAASLLEAEAEPGPEAARRMGSGGVAGRLVHAAVHARVPGQEELGDQVLTALSEQAAGREPQ